MALAAFPPNSPDTAWYTRLGLRWPIVQAPMAGVQDAALALAVTREGGLGSLPAAMLTPAALRSALEALSGQGAFNVNFFCHTDPVPDPARESAWRRRLAPFYRELGLTPPEPDGPIAPASRRPFNAEMADLLVECRPAVVSFHFGLPEAALLERVQRSGAWVMASATTVDEALWLQRHGAHAVIAQGLEAGGHRGHFLSGDLSLQAGLWTLLPQVLDAVSIPVIAAGGIACPRGVAAAQAMGAAGVQVGSAYLLADEALTHPLHRAALQERPERPSALTRLFSGRPARGLVNRLMRAWDPMDPLAPDFPLASAALAPLRAQAEAQGSGDFSPLWAGQAAHRAQPGSAAAITERLAQGWQT